MRTKMARIEAIILSMTPKERANPDLLNPSRKHRIAKGAGVDISRSQQVGQTVRTDTEDDEDSFLE